MKREKLMRAIGEIDEKYLEEAESLKKRRYRGWMSAVAAVLCVCLCLTGMWALLKPFDAEDAVKGYKDSEYYPIIKLLNESENKNTNGTYAGLTLGGLFDGALKGDAAAEGAVSGNTSTNGADSDRGDYFYSYEGEAEYVEVTDNQTEGVIEADIIKRSDRYIYYLSGEELLVYTIAGEDTDIAGSFRLDSIYEDSSGEGERFFYVERREMYLSPDCKTVIIIHPFSEKIRMENGGGRVASYVLAAAIDVSDPENISIKDRITVSGSYLSSRFTDGSLYIFSDYYIESPDYSDEKSFIPRIDTGAGLECIAMEDIICPEEINSRRYTVVCKLDGNSFELEDEIAFFSYYDTLYMSKTAIYVSRRFNETKEEGSYRSSSVYTEISAVSYGDGDFKPLGSVKIEGYLKDQYSLDEYEGNLRAVSTTDSYSYRSSGFTVGESSYVETETDSFNGTSASLYVIDLYSFNIIASVERFAPVGETVRSVRFDGESAYVCTAVQLTDPVFFFDLSDVNNITYKDTGNIDGFSSSLIDLGDGFLLGIGTGSSSSTVKIEIYEESENGVVSVDKFEFDNSYYSTDYKSYFIDRERGLFGFGVNSDYYLFCFDGVRLNKVLSLKMDRDPSLMRAVYDDGYFYVFADNVFAVKRISF